MCMTSSAPPAPAASPNTAAPHPRLPSDRAARPRVRPLPHPTNVARLPHVLTAAWVGELHADRVGRAASARPHGVDRTSGNGGDCAPESCTRTAGAATTLL